MGNECLLQIWTLAGTGRRLMLTCAAEESVICLCKLQVMLCVCYCASGRGGHLMSRIPADQPTPTIQKQLTCHKIVQMPPSAPHPPPQQLLSNLLFVQTSHVQAVFTHRHACLHGVSFCRGSRVPVSRPRRRSRVRPSSSSLLLSVSRIPTAEPLLYGRSGVASAARLSRAAVPSAVCCGALRPQLPTLRTERPSGRTQRVWAVWPMRIEQRMSFLLGCYAEATRRTDPTARGVCASDGAVLTL